MQNTTLKLGERIVLWNLIGGHQVQSLKEASVYLRIIDKLRLSDEEMREVQFVNDGRQYQWITPPNGYGDRTVAFEDEEAKSLVKALESPPQGVRISDAVWMQRVVDECGGKKQEELQETA